MSERELRKRHTGKGKAISRSRAPRPSPSPSDRSRRRIKPAGGIKWRRPIQKFKLLTRSNSEPWLWKPGGDAAAAAVAAEEEVEAGVLYRPRTCVDIFSSPDSLVPPSPANRSERYNKDTKVVINVTVEGSPGPIRTMVKLGSNVEEITKLVVKKYNEEGRTPLMDKDAFSTYELHHSYFSLEGLSKSDLIADVGSRSFYLRRSSSSYCSDDKTPSNQPESSSSSSLLLPFLPMFVNRKIKKVMRRTRKVWKIFGCITCDG